MKFRDRIPAAVFLFVVGMALTACNAYKKPSVKNFTGAIDGYYSQHDECLFPSALHFPYEVSTGDTDEIWKKLDALMNAGLLKRDEEKAIGIKRYSLTPYAMKRATPNFCYGHRVVTSIDDFTPPAMVQGLNTTRVSYHYKMMDLPGWAQSKQMMTTFPALARSTSDQAHDTATVVLTLNGWRVPE